MTATRLSRAVARAIHQHRVAQRLSVEDLAVAADCSPTTIRLIENGARVPSLGMIERIAAGLGTTPRALMPDDPAPQVPDHHLALRGFARLVGDELARLRAIGVPLDQP